MPFPVTPERFVMRAQKHARRTRVTIGSAMEAVAQELSDDELHSLTAEFEQIVFGSDTAARDAARREVLGEAACPNRTTLNSQELKDQK